MVEGARKQLQDNVSKLGETQDALKSNNFTLTYGYFESAFYKAEFFDWLRTTKDTRFQLCQKKSLKKELLIPAIWT